MLRRNLIQVCAGILVLAGLLMGAAGGCPTAPAPVAKTGQTTSYGSGDDGALQLGASITPRFTDHGNGTVTDNLTGLIWTKEAGCSMFTTWSGALIACNELQDGLCGLSDGSTAGTWRLPNVRELQSLIDYANDEPPLPTGHPFTNVDTIIGIYWTSTTTVTPYATAVRTVHMTPYMSWGGTIEPSGATLSTRISDDVIEQFWCVR